jgi:hypothetical protein
MAAYFVSLTLLKILMTSLNEWISLGLHPLICTWAIEEDFFMIYLISLIHSYATEKKVYELVNFICLFQTMGNFVFTSWLGAVKSELG